ncbi:MAG: hypothetical protein V4592_25535 [Bacteroidota bacterium]
MGQRTNYILIEDGKQTIHYNHWRANCITFDLYLGEKKFIEFVKECRVVNVLLDEHWIEGCVIIDCSKKALYFWSFEFEKTSVIPFYLNKLQDKWKGWNITLLYNRMYDVEKVLNNNYLNKQEPIEFSSHPIDEFINDKVDEWVAATIVIKTGDELHVTQTGTVGVNSIICFGEPIINILLNKSACQLPNEDDDNIYECIVIDTIKKEIIIDKSEYGLWEQSSTKWPGYKFKMGDYGYIAALNLTGINTGKLVMSPVKAYEVFKNMTRQHSDFDPLGFTKVLLTQQKDIIFSPGFFDNVNPKKTLLERVKIRIRKMTIKR